MDMISIVLIAVGLAMDAFAVAICKGMALSKPKVRAILIIGIWFGFFQALMPVIGFYVGRSFYDIIADYDHWVAFILLAAIGVNMLREGLSDDDEAVDDDIGMRTMFILAIATSIDALAIGISLAMTETSIVMPAVVIGIVTFMLSAMGVKLGSIVGDRFGSKAEILGGSILVLIGLKILLEHTIFA